MFLARFLRASVEVDSAGALRSRLTGVLGLWPDGGADTLSTNFRVTVRTSLYAVACSDVCWLVSCAAVASGAAIEAAVEDMSSFVGAVVDAG